MSNFASQNSKWLKSYSERVSKAKQKSNGNKGLIPIIFTCIMGAFMGIMIANGGLDDPQKVGGIKILGVITCVMLLLSIILIAKGKKKNVTSRTAENLDALLTSAEEVAEFDKQMNAAPLFRVENDANDCYFATKDYFGRKFSDMGNETYEFIHVRDIAAMHYRGMKVTGVTRSYAMDLRDASGKVLMNGFVNGTSKIEALKDNLGGVLAGASFVEDEAES